MKTPSTLAQATQVLEAIGRLSKEQVQGLIERGDLLKSLATCPRLHSINSFTFNEFINTETWPSIPLTPVSDFTRRIKIRSDKRGWGFTQSEIDKLAADLLERNHSGKYMPTSVNIWLGKDLAYNWTEMMLWIKDEINYLGCTFNYQDFNEKYIELLELPPDSTYSYESRILETTKLDLSTFKESSIPEHHTPKKMRTSRDSWPSMEILALLALNPQVFVNMNCRLVSGIWILGLNIKKTDRFGNNLVVYFKFYNNTATIIAESEANQWVSSTMAAYRS